MFDSSGGSLESRGGLGVASPAGLPREAGSAEGAVLTTAALMSDGWVDTVEAVPVLSRSVLNADGGGHARHLARAKLVALGSAIPPGTGLFITLTVDRSRFVDAETAFVETRHRVCDLMRELLGPQAVWSCCVEYQTRTGEGWPHYHILCKQGEIRSLRKLRHIVHEAWNARWHCGKCVDVQAVGSGKATAIYLAKYLTKTAHAIPPWVLLRQFAPRMISTSWAAGALVQGMGESAARTLARACRAESDSPARRSRVVRARSRVVDRLAWSGMRCRLRRQRVNHLTGESLRPVWLSRPVQAAFVDVAGAADSGVGRVAVFPAADLGELAGRLEASFGELQEGRVIARQDELLAAWDSS